MCYLVTVAIPSGFHQRLRKELSSDVKLDPHLNPHIAKQLPFGFDTFMLTTGDADHQCSCCLYSPCKPSTAQEPDPVEMLRNKYRQLGWSPGKIERAVATARVEHERRLALEFDGLRPDVYKALRQTLPQLKTLFLLVHEYVGKYDSESFSMTRNRVTRQEFSEGNYPVEEDTLLEVVQ